jgi:hypothetical protein
MVRMELFLFVFELRSISDEMPFFPNSKFAIAGDTISSIENSIENSQFFVSVDHSLCNSTLFLV